MSTQPRVIRLQTTRKKSTLANEEENGWKNCSEAPPPKPRARQATCAESGVKPSTLHTLLQKPLKNTSSLPYS